MFLFIHWFFIYYIKELETFRNYGGGVFSENNFLFIFFFSLCYSRLLPFNKNYRDSNHIFAEQLQDLLPIDNISVGMFTCAMWSFHAYFLLQPNYLLLMSSIRNKMWMPLCFLMSSHLCLIISERVCNKL